MALGEFASTRSAASRAKNEGPIDDRPLIGMLLEWPERCVAPKACCQTSGRPVIQPAALAAPSMR